MVVWPVAGESVSAKGGATMKLIKCAWLIFWAMGAAILSIAIGRSDGHVRGDDL